MALLAVTEAQRIVLEHTQRAVAETYVLSEICLGDVLAEAVACERDSPPFDKAMVDGYAIVASDIAAGKQTFRVTHEILAGQFSESPVVSGEAASIMTGAPLPPDADAVVMLEQTELVGDQVRIPVSVKPRQNIMARGSEMRAGEVILQPGAVLRAMELGLLATLGRAAAQLFRRPRVAILSTGDEVVEPGQPLGMGQIRNSNASMLAALVQREHGIPRYHGIARDTVSSLGPAIQRGLQDDVLLITGGVSAGKVDLVPEVLAQMGVETHFHKVSLKPGKPLLFGTRGNTLVFGLPGNPVSGLVGFELFVAPALRKMLGKPEPHIPETLRANWSIAGGNRSDRPTYFPVKLHMSDGRYIATPLAWKGSGDLRTLSEADALAVFPAGEVRYAAGDSVNVLRLL